MSKLLFLFCLLIWAVFSQKTEECQVSLKPGNVTGVLTDTFNPNKKVCSFLSIPYARPPVGSLRFEPPQPALPWNSTLEGTQLPNWCPQKGSPPRGRNISEDCLYLNVYQPKNVTKVSRDGLPVMIWFHGGSFTGGSSDTYTPERLLARGDVILVVVHYRLGLLGFLSTGDTTVPGNNGLKDQAFSIRWTHENIAAFGGNPGKITIFGESAGGASVAYQYLSPLNKGLIYGAIAQSGTALATWAIDRKPAEGAKVMSKRLGCPEEIGREMVACLRDLTWERIVKQQGDYSSDVTKNMTYAHATMTPVIESKDVENAFISEDPVKIMESGDIPNVPLLLGANKHDGSFILAGMYLAKFFPKGLWLNPNFMKNEIVLDILKYVGIEDPEPGNRAIASSVELAFLDGVDRRRWSTSMPGLVDVLSVLGYKSAAQTTAELLSRRNRQVYLYSMEHHSKNTMWPIFFGALAPLIPVEHGIAHADDLLYLFELPSKFSAEDQAFSDIMVDMWVNFASTGDPTPTKDNRFGEWTPYNSESESYIKLNTTPTVKQGYRNSWRPNGFEWN